MTDRKMTPKQALFVDEYLIDLNATQAAIRAGYSPRSARTIGQENLARPHLAWRIEKAKVERATRTGIAADKVIAEIAKIALSDIRRLFGDDGSLRRPEELSADAAASIASIEVVTRSAGGGEVIYVHKVRPWDKVRALELLCRHLGLLTDKVHVSGNLSARILAARKRVGAAS